MLTVSKMQTGETGLDLKPQAITHCNKRNENKKGENVFNRLTFPSFLLSSWYSLHWQRVETLWFPRLCSEASIASLHHYILSPTLSPSNLFHPQSNTNSPLHPANNLMLLLITRCHLSQKLTDNLQFSLLNLGTLKGGNDKHKAKYNGKKKTQQETKF